MSKFQELSQVVDECRREGMKYHHRSLDAMGKILDGFVEYLEAPQEAVRFFPYGENTDKEPPYTALGAAKINNDGWWDSALTLLINGIRLIFRFRLRTDIDKFQVRVGDSDKRHAFVSPTPEALAPVWDEAFERATLYLQTALPRRIDATSSKQATKIGFHVS
jgi:hypothetical protein